MHAAWLLKAGGQLVMEGDRVRLVGGVGREIRRHGGSKAPVKLFPHGGVCLLLPAVARVLEHALLDRGHRGLGGRRDVRAAHGNENRRGAGLARAHGVAVGGEKPVARLERALRTCGNPRRGRVGCKRARYGSGHGGGRWRGGRVALDVLVQPVGSVLRGGAAVGLVDGLDGRVDGPLGGVACPRDVGEDLVAARGIAHVCLEELVGVKRGGRAIGCGDGEAPGLLGQCASGRAEREHADCQGGRDAGCNGARDGLSHVHRLPSRLRGDGCASMPPQRQARRGLWHR